MHYSTALARPLVTLALAFGLLAPSAAANAAGGIDSKVYAGAECHVTIRSNDPTVVPPMRSILENRWGRAVDVMCPIVRDSTDKQVEFAEVRVLADRIQDVACTLYARTNENEIRATFLPDGIVGGFGNNGRIFTFFLQGDSTVLRQNDSLSLFCTLQPNTAIVQYRVDEIE